MNPERRSRRYSRRAGEQEIQPARNYWDRDRPPKVSVQLRLRPGEGMITVAVAKGVVWWALIACCVSMGLKCI